MNFPSLCISLRRNTDDSSARRWTNADCGAGLDQAAKTLQGDLRILKNRRTFSLVQYQREYDVASDCLQPDLIEFWDVDNPWPVDAKGLDSYRELYRNFTRSSIPAIYLFLEEERKYLLAPIPDTAAAATTLVATINSSVTTMTLTSSVNFPTAGRLIVNSEVIEYTNNARSTGILTGLTRAMEDTTAASHTSADTITERDMFIWQARNYMDREMRNYYHPGSTATASTIAITKGAKALVGTNSKWSTSGQVAVGDYFGITPSGIEIDPLQWYKVATITDDTNIILATNFAELTQTAGAYIIGSPNPFPAYVDPALLALARSYMLEKSNPDMSRAQYGKYKAIIAEVRKSHTKSDETLIAGSRPERRRVGRMRLRMLNRTI